MLLTIVIPTVEENINSVKRSIIKGSKEEKSFIKEVIASFRSLNTSNLSNIPSLEKIIGDFADIVAESYEKYTKNINITKHSKSLWDRNCSSALEKYRNMKNLKNWKLFCHTVKNTKRSFFDSKIQEIANKKQEPWELMNWVNKQRLSAIKMFKYNGLPCLEINDL